MKPCIGYTPVQKIMPERLGYWRFSEHGKLSMHSHAGAWERAKGVCR